MLRIQILLCFNILVASKLLCQLYVLFTMDPKGILLQTSSAMQFTTVNVGSSIDWIFVCHSVNSTLFRFLSFILHGLLACSHYCQKLRFLCRILLPNVCCKTKNKKKLEIKANKLLYYCRICPKYCRNI